MELFKPHLKLPRARMTCLLMLVLAVISERTVSLVWLAKHPDNDAGTASVYRGFQRFLALCHLPSRAVGRLVPALVPGRTRAGSSPWTAPTGSSEGPTSTSSW